MPCMVESYVDHIEHQHIEKGLEEPVHDLTSVECYFQFPVCSIKPNIPLVALEPPEPYEIFPTYHTTF
ncbi:hypothetical protein ZOSMA_54G00060 [Zostera marina]|uniref:Uncharacterized protein n=1 Tax=Zostera marina TaxID=29655 RepID=A0A0K9NYJ7_ZOSMR|nr:hypothetical protein ZOSMA_54G00060 [Zostera marina]